jgi:hypothetical protein
VPAVIVVILSVPDVVVLAVNPEVLILYSDGYLRITIPEPPEPPVLAKVFAHSSPPSLPLPPLPVFAPPLTGVNGERNNPPSPPMEKVVEVPKKVFCTPDPPVNLAIAVLAAPPPPPPLLFSAPRPPLNP